MELVFNVDPIAKGRPRMMRSGIVYTPKETRDFESLIRNLIKSQWRKGVLESALNVSITFTIRQPKSVRRVYPSVRPDLDNYIKAILDAANGVIWNDDAQVIELHAYKRYGSSGRILMSIDEVRTSLEISNEKKDNDTNDNKRK